MIESDKKKAATYYVASEAVPMIFFTIIHCSFTYKFTKLTPRIDFKRWMKLFQEFHRLTGHIENKN